MDNMKGTKGPEAKQKSPEAGDLLEGCFNPACTQLLPQTERPTAAKSSTAAWQW